MSFTSLTHQVQLSRDEAEFDCRFCSPFKGGWSWESENNSLSAEPSNNPNGSHSKHASPELLGNPSRASYKHLLGTGGRNSPYSREVLCLPAGSYTQPCLISGAGDTSLPQLRFQAGLCWLCPRAQTRSAERSFSCAPASRSGAAHVLLGT